MATKHTKAKKQITKDSRVSMTIDIPTELEAELIKRAKEMKMHPAEYVSRILEEIFLQGQIERMIEKKMDQAFEPFIFQLTTAIAEIEKMKRISKRVLEDPSADIVTIIREVEEERRN